MIYCILRVIIPTCQKKFACNLNLSHNFPGHAIGILERLEKEQRGFADFIHNEWQSLPLLFEFV